MPAVATTDLMRMMGHIFPFTSLPWVLESCTSGFQKVTADQFEAVNEHDRRKYRWKIIHYPHRIRLFWWYRDALMKDFRFRPDLVEYANSKLASVAGGRQVTFVAVHGSNGHLVGAPFYHSAINLCRQRYSEPVFIVTSDDLKWCRENLSGTDIYLLGDPRSEFPGVERDLALLAACNHTIFDYGTYGFFAAFLAGGDMILAEGYSEREHEIIEELREGNITATYIDGNGTVLPKCARCR
ncbi:galactoside alpha-(1,2)-fucosyltransferase 1-like isoform X2 [Amphibalanus amphitrite]|uniref:galactoside alpha-(1,2)-fucosyltransferase 1-like isoform X2 n=1 Tax=Amphibalanus amphitrite TaxID=1232801 RepID=UPI001C91DEFD|nr:galactoside alpha-(1,2)-fucosyltransferase 1-like isoform X2 [Amphibalanus amphitrite]